MNSMVLGAFFAMGLLVVSACEKSAPEPIANEPVRSKASAGTGSAGVQGQTATQKSSFAPVRVVLDEKAMGTQVTLAAYTTPAMDEPTLRDKLKKAHEEIKRLEQIMTTWREDSEISKVNQEAGKKAVALSPESVEVIKKSLWIAKESEGVFDITFDAMKGVWKFDQDLEAKVPSQKLIDERRKRIDYRKLKLDEKNRTLMIEKEGMRINLGGIAKGYAIDAASAVLKKEGVNAFFAQAGGDLYVAGKKPDGSSFKVGIRDPRGAHAGDYFAMIEVVDHAFSTAGDYERSFILNEKRYHHIIDPRTGYPAMESRSVTIWAKDAHTADAIDDAVFILGPEKGLKLVESIDDCGAVIVDKNNKVWISKRLEGKVQMLRQPTDGI